jgi:hypothetical protein
MLFFSHGSTTLVGIGLLYEVPRSHSYTPHPVGLLWTSDLPWQHTTRTRDRPSRPRRDSIPQSQKSSGRRHTLWTTRLPESATKFSQCISFLLLLRFFWSKHRLFVHTLHTVVLSDELPSLGGTNDVPSNEKVEHFWKHSTLYHN